jgi:kynurenine formamidase
VGTHVDAFKHVNPDGQPVDEMPLDLFMGKAVCLDLRHIPDLGEITLAHMEEAEKKAGVKVDGHIVLLCSGFHKRTYPGLDSVWKNPQLTVEATQWMYDRGSRMHGVEGPSTDRPSDNIFSQHRLCRRLGISHWEWLVNLEELLGKGEFQFFGVPLKFKGGSGSPVRAFAIVNN